MLLISALHADRTMHISGELKEQYIEPKKQYIGEIKQYIDEMIALGLTRKTATNAINLFSAFGLEKVFSRTDAAAVLGITITPASTLLKRLASVGIAESVKGLGKGKYRFSPDFSKRTNKAAPLRAARCSISKTEAGGI